MAETLTPRFQLRIWGASSDTPSRIEFNDIHQKLEDNAAIDAQGTFAARPVAGIRGRYYWATDQNTLYRDNGSAWLPAASAGTNSTFSSSSINSVPLTANGLSGQTESVFSATVNGSEVASIEANGDLIGRSIQTKYGQFTGNVAAQTVIAGKGAAAQTGDLLRLRDSADADLFKVQAGGQVVSKFFAASDAKAVVGTQNSSNVGNMSLFSGTAALEIYGNKGGANATFNEFVYLRHQAADATATSRRLGFMMKIGDETVADAARSGAVYIESSAANANNPDLVLARGDSPVFRFRQDGTSTLDSRPTINGTTTITPGAAASLVMGGTAIGDQNSSNDMYFRTATNNSFYWYAGGTHSDSAGNNGGGTTLASLVKSGSGGIFNTDRMTLTQGDRSADSSTPVIRLGPSGGTRLHFDEEGIQAVTSTSTPSALYLNWDGGDINMGDTPAGTAINLDGKVYIQGKRITIATAAPSSPATGDVWIDI